MEIAEILDLDRIVVDAESTSKKAVLEKLASLLSSADTALTSAIVFDCLLARERLGTTGLGSGIAIPHGRVASNGKAIGAFIRTINPIDFDAVDSLPVDIFFALCVPEEATDEHLALLSALAANFSDPKFVEVIREADSPADIYKHLISKEHTKRLPEGNDQ
jgi:nitrogen PTS system EIIA component